MNPHDNRHSRDLIEVIVMEALILKIDGGVDQYLEEVGVPLAEDVSNI